MSVTLSLIVLDAKTLARYAFLHQNLNVLLARSAAPPSCSIAHTLICVLWCALVYDTKTVARPDIDEIAFFYWFSHIKGTGERITEKRRSIWVAALCAAVFYGDVFDISPCLGAQFATVLCSLFAEARIICAVERTIEGCEWSKWIWFD